MIVWIVTIFLLVVVWFLTTKVLDTAYQAIDKRVFPKLVEA